MGITIVIWSIMFIKNDNRRKSTLLKLLIIIVGILIVLLIIPLLLSGGSKSSGIWGSLFSSMSNIDEDTRFLGRVERWIKSKDAILVHPIIGYGVGASGDTMDKYNISKFFITSHNMILKIMLETGIFGLMAYIFSFYKII